MINGVAKTKVSVPKGGGGLAWQAFVLGQPVDHSLSPALHSAAYSYLGQEVSYGKLPTDVDQLAQRFAMAEQAANVCGFSCTMPLKTAVVQYLDRLSDCAALLGVVNTVCWPQGPGSGISLGHNTDVSGIVNALCWAGARPGSVGSFALLGGGGTATAALAAARYLGADSVDVYIRHLDRGQNLSKVASKLGLALNFYRLATFAQHYRGYSCLVSTLPSGAADVVGAELREPTSAILLDVSYDPWPSVLARAWQRQGGRVVSGKDMLMYQAIDQVKLFLGFDLEQALPDELQVMNAMCSAIGLEPRSQPAHLVYSVQEIAADS